MDYFGTREIIFDKNQHVLAPCLEHFVQLALVSEGSAYVDSSNCGLKTLREKLQLVVMRAQTCNPSTLDAEAGAL